MRRLARCCSPASRRLVGRPGAAASGRSRPGGDRGRAAYDRLRFRAALSPATRRAGARASKGRCSAPRLHERPCDRNNAECRAAAQAIARSSRQRMSASRPGAARTNDGLCAGGSAAAGPIGPAWPRPCAPRKAALRRGPGPSLLAGRAPASRERQREIEQQASAGEPDPWREAAQPVSGTHRPSAALAGSAAGHYAACATQAAASTETLTKKPS